ncbi:hypothetical protein BD413DRAFT_484324 [Trametes elegans]|nr:hypothetical protein BD413DRAFT_484324 [Trametes elegans]
MGTPRSAPVATPDDVEQSPGGPARSGSAPDGKPAWTVFPSRAFRGPVSVVTEVVNTWDDERLLISLKKAYSDLCAWYERCLCQAMCVNDALIYPQHVRPGRMTAHRKLRMRYLLDYPAHMRGQHEFVHALTTCGAAYGVEFVEGWRNAHVVAIVLASTSGTIAFALAYGVAMADWPGGFTITAFFSQLFTQLFALLAYLQYHQF